LPSSGAMSSCKILSGSVQRGTALVLRGAPSAWRVLAGMRGGGEDDSAPSEVSGAKNEGDENDFMSDLIRRAVDEASAEGSKDEEDRLRRKESMSKAAAVLMSRLQRMEDGVDEDEDDEAGDTDDIVTQERAIARALSRVATDEDVHAFLDKLHELKPGCASLLPRPSSPAACMRMQSAGAQTDVSGSAAAERARQTATLGCRAGRAERTAPARRPRGRRCSTQCASATRRAWPSCWMQTRRSRAQQSRGTSSPRCTGRCATTSRAPRRARQASASRTGAAAGMECRRPRRCCWR